jgi:parallel beta-helix repeat protein
MQGFNRPRLAVAAVAAGAASLSGLAMAAPAHAANIINVNGTTGSDTGAGGTWKTIAEGVTHASPGDTVDVAPGTYAEPTVSIGKSVNVVSTTSGGATVTHGFSLNNAGGATVDGFTVDTAGTGAAFTVKNSSGAVLTNNTVTHSGAPSFLPNPVPPNFAIGSNGTPAVWLSSAGSVTFRGNKVDGNAYTGIVVSGSGGATVKNNTVSNNVDTNVDPAARFAAGITVKAPGVNVLANTVHDNEDSGVQFYGGATGGNQGVAVDNVVYDNGDHGIDNLNVTGGTVVNNTVFHNATAGINVEGSSSGYTVENNVSADNAYPGNPAGRSKGDIRVAQSATGPGGITLDHNLVFNSFGGVVYNWDTNNGPGTGVNSFYGTAGTGIKAFSAFHTDTLQGANDKNADPKFVSSATPDLHITAGSGAVGLALTTAPKYQTTDRDGKTWATPDAGAYALNGTGGGTPPPNGKYVQRLSGDDRYGTGLAVSAKQWAAGTAKAVVLAKGMDYPDALSGVPLAASKKGPLLLTDSASLSPAVSAEITRVLGADKTKTVYILGGNAAVNVGVENAVKALGYNVQRYGGADRFETSRIIAAQGLGSPSHAIVATGLNFADALAAGPLAAGPFASPNGVPAAVVLSNGGTLDSATKAYLAGKTVDTVGGPAATAAAAAGITTTDVFTGNDRYETAEKVAKKFTAPKTVGVATGAQFPDALTGGAFMATAGGPILLTATSGLEPAADAVVKLFAGSLQQAYIFGGTSALKPAVASSVAADLGTTTIIG